jgi:hypothetical protein
LLLGSGAGAETTTTALVVKQEVARVPAVSPATRALPATIERLRRRRAAALRRLGRATAPQRQARASGQLERAYLGAGRAVGESAGTGPELDHLRAALRRTAVAYGQLAEASAAGDATGYNAARKPIRHGERAVRRALDAVD